MYFLAIHYHVHLLFMNSLIEINFIKFLFFYLKLKTKKVVSNLLVTDKSILINFLI